MYVFLYYIYYNLHGNRRTLNNRRPYFENNRYPAVVHLPRQQITPACTDKKENKIGEQNLIVQNQGASKHENY